MSVFHRHIFVILWTISSIQGRCPAGNSVKIYGHSGVVTAKSGYNRKDKCEWKIFAPRQKRNHKIIVNISKITCSKNLIIQGEDFCQHKPRITRTYIPNSCKEDCKLSSCRKVNGYPLIITYGRYADDHGFVIRFAYERCAAGSIAVPKKETTSQPATPRLIMTSMNSNRIFDEIERNVTSSITPVSENTTALELVTRDSTLSEVSSVSEIPIVAIIAPVAAVLVITILLIITGVIIRKTKQRNKMKKQAESIETIQSYIRTSNVTGAALYETLNKNISTQAYTNEPAAASQATVSETHPPATHIYEHVKSAGVVTSEIPKLDHQYDEVASETDSFDDCSSEEEGRD